MVPSNLARACLILAATLWVAVSAVPAHAQIRSPNHHTAYSVELEPHLVLQWTDQPFWNDDGVGLGFRASIPVLANGPIPSINNNLAIGFGLDWAHFDGCGPWNGACGANSFLFPIVAQWNFFLTEWFSIFPELGLAVAHARLTWDGTVPDRCARVNGIDVCRSGASHTYFDLALWLGARFSISNHVAFTLRLGTPSILIGAAFSLAVGPIGPSRRARPGARHNQVPTTVAMPNVSNHAPA
jgi:hypothetical protein